MKKIILILTLILIVTYVLLSVVSKNDDYDMERMYFQAMKSYKEIADNPDVVPPAMLASVEGKLERIIKKYPDNPSAPAVKKVLAEFYLNNKQFDKARILVDQLLEESFDNAAMSSQMQFLKGLIFERQGKWKKALEEYMILRDHYRDTPLGFQVPMYISNYYRQKGAFDLCDQTLREAVTFYEGIEIGSKGKLIGYMAANMLLRCYIELKEHDLAAVELSNIFDTYPAELTYAQQLPKVELIFIKLLKSPEKALDVYKKIKKVSKDSKIIDYIDQKIEQLVLEKPQ